MRELRHLSSLHCRLILLLLLAGIALSRPLTSPGFDGDAGVNADFAGGYGGSVLLLGSRPSNDNCEGTYGFLPCTESAFGNLFLIVVYGYLMFNAASFLTSGSELLLEVLGPGVIGGLLLPLIGAFPDALLILVSGLSGTKKAAQDQVLIGMGLLAGSTVMLLTLLWGSCLIVGKVDLSENSSTTQHSFFGTGVTTDQQTSYSARILVISIIPYIIIEVPKMFGLSSAGTRVTVLIALVVSVVSLLVYCLYQVIDPWIQNRRLAYAKNKNERSALLKHWQKHMLGKFLNSDGEPKEDSIKDLFHKIDSNKNNTISKSELSSLVVGMRFEEMEFGKEEAINRIMSDFDLDNDGNLSYEEFYTGISKWINEAKSVVARPGNQSTNFIEEYDRLAKEEHNMLLGDRDEDDESVGNPRWNIFKAVMLLVLGAVMAAVFADPLVDVVQDFSEATSIPSFFISFIFMPLATNSSEGVSAIIFASRKNQKSSSLTYSEIYGSATMNNTLCLAVFLSLVYVRHLTWDFSSEVLIIVIVILVMGIFGSFRTKFPLWTCSIAFVLYPLSLGLVYVLDYVVGWS